MWIFTPEGYVSGVEDKSDPTVIVVRARDHASLRALCTAVDIKPSKIKLGGGTDYPYRVRVSRQQFATFAYEAAYGIAYTNFKDEATRVRGNGYHDVLLSIWSTTFRLTPDRITKKLRKRSAAAVTRWTGGAVSGKWSSVDDWLREADERAGGGVHALTDEEWFARETERELPPETGVQMTLDSV